MSKPTVFLATTPFMNGLLLGHIQSEFDVQQLHLAPDTGLGGPETHWRVQLYQAIESAGRGDGGPPPKFVFVGVAGREDPFGTCCQLLEWCPKAHVLAVSLDERAERVVRGHCRCATFANAKGVVQVEYRSATIVYEAEVTTREQLLALLRWAVADEAGVAGGQPP